MPGLVIPSGLNNGCQLYGYESFGVTRVTCRSGLCPGIDAGLED